MKQEGRKNDVFDFIIYYAFKNLLEFCEVPF